MSEIFFRVYTQAFKSGLVRELGKERWLLLTALAAYMDEDGKAYPTQDQLAEDVGMGRRAVTRILKQLKEFTFNGKPIITVEKHGNGFNNNNVYTILPAAQIAIFHGQIENDTSNPDPGMCHAEHIPEPITNLESVTGDTFQTPRKCHERHTNNIQPINNTTVNNKELFKNGKDVVAYFTRKYREAYNVNYSVSWGRDGANGKKLLETFGPDKVKDIIDVVFEEYEDRWKKAKYPRPSLGQIASWLGNEALALVEEVRAREARLEAAEQEEPQDVEAIMARLNRRKV